jgi:hypothetical protein
MHTHIVEIALEHSNSQRGKGLKIAQGLPLILGATEDTYETSYNAMDIHIVGTVKT